MHIYIHIPFCRQACHYCDFHFSTTLKNKEPFLTALKKEIFLRKDYLDAKVPISTVYFGGGTPSLLTQKEITEILDELNKYFLLEKNAEITLEANPDDLSKEKIAELKATPVNRLSIGVQSFSDKDLRFMNRAHSAEQAIASIKTAQYSGFKNITIDLIYGIPALTHVQWMHNLATAFAMNVHHISAYCLTVEPKTALANFIKTKKVKNVDEEQSATQFEILMDEMERHKFIQYEISNFGKENYCSLHNMSYWKGEYYLGLGASAHSFNGFSRQWNIANNNLYIKSLENNELNFEHEVLSETNKFNEYILTSLRTIWGCDLNFVKTTFGEKFFKRISENAQSYIVQKRIIRNENFLVLSRSGKLIADRIISDFLE